MDNIGEKVMTRLKGEPSPKEITVYWWNCGKKTLDFRGTYKGFFMKRDIRVTDIVSNGVKGFHFDIPLAFSKATYDTYDTDYSRCCDDAIKIFLTLMGDKAKLISGREFYINWK